MTAHDQLDRYLRDLTARLRGSSATRRRCLEECADHLLTAAAALSASGMADDLAMQTALNRFGAVADVAAAFNLQRRRHLACTRGVDLARIAGMGCLVIGASAAGSWVLGLLLGTGRVFHDGPGVHYAPAACSHFLSVQPAASTCTQAALLEARDDSLFQRTAIGLVGLILVLTVLWWQRRRPREFSRALSLSVATTYGLVGGYLLLYAIDRSIIGTGAGQWYVSAVIALAAASLYARQAMITRPWVSAGGMPSSGPAGHRPASRQ